MVHMGVKVICLWMRSQFQFCYLFNFSIPENPVSISDLMYTLPIKKFYSYTMQAKKNRSLQESRLVGPIFFGLHCLNVYTYF